MYDYFAEKVAVISNTKIFFALITNYKACLSKLLRNVWTTYKGGVGNSLGHTCYIRNAI